MKTSIDSVTKRFGTVPALESVSLDIEPGEIVALVGPNGAGKTTLLRCLAGIAVPDDGRILYDEQLFRRDRMDLRRRFFFLPDFPFVYSEMKVFRHIAMVLRLYEVENDGVDDTVIDLLREFEILPLAESRLGTLSRGQAYKAALVALLAVNPELWMFDEPFASGMDPHGLSMFKRKCREAVGLGRTVIYTTQLLDVAETFSDRLCIIDRGSIHAFDTVADLESREGELEEVFERLSETN